MDFLRTKTGFFICILLPIALFFLFELYKLIATIIEIKRPAITESDEEEIKRRAVGNTLHSRRKRKRKMHSRRKMTNNCCLGDTL